MREMSPSLVLLLVSSFCTVLKDLYVPTGKGLTPNFKAASQCRFGFCSFKMNQDLLSCNVTVMRRAVSYRKDRAEFALHNLCSLILFCKLTALHQH